MRPKEFNEKEAGKEFSSALLNDFRQNYWGCRSLVFRIGTRRSHRVCQSRSKAGTRPAALTCISPRAHWPKVSVAWGNFRHQNRALKGANSSGNPFVWNGWPSSRPVHPIPVHPTPHRPNGLCTVGLDQVKAAGLVKVYDLILSRKSSAEHAI